MAWTAGDSSSAGVSRMPARQRRVSAMWLGDRLAARDRWRQDRGAPSWQRGQPFRESTALLPWQWRANRGRKCLQPQRQSAPAQRRCTLTAWERTGSHSSPSSISQQPATIAAIVLLLLRTGICGYRLRLCQTYKGRVYCRCSQGGHRSLADLDIRKNCHPCKKLCRSDGKRIFWAFRRLQPALDCCCRLRVGERGVGTVRRPAVMGEPCRVRGPPSA